MYVQSGLTERLTLRREGSALHAISGCTTIGWAAAVTAYNCNLTGKLLASLGQLPQLYGQLLSGTGFDNGTFGVHVGMVGFSFSSSFANFLLLLSCV